MLNDERYDRQEVGDTLDRLVALVAYPVLEPALSPEARVLFDAGSRLSGKTTYTEREMLGYLLMLDAIIACPEAIQAALRHVRAELIRNEPALALLGGNTPLA